MDVAYILNNYQAHEQNLKDRFVDIQLLADCKITHTEYTKCLYTGDQLRKFSNKISKMISTNKNKQSIQTEQIDEENFVFTDEVYVDLNFVSNLRSMSPAGLINVGQKVKKFIGINEIRTKNLFELMKKNIYQIPNMLHTTAPIFKSEDDNPVIKMHMMYHPYAVDNLLDQYVLSKKLDILEDASDVAGHRGYFLVNAGVKLNYALIMYALDFLSKNNYKLMATPHFINRSKIDMISQLSDYQETLYELKDEDKFLIATSEQPLTAYFNGKMCKDLPVKLGGMSSCYRKEAGKHGQDTLGIFRVHQFEKVEQFCVTDAESSWPMMENMINLSAQFYESLGLSYRIVNIASAALNNSAAMKYDLEGYFPGSKKFRELVSCTNTTDYFSRRLKTVDKHGKQVHMLNCTLCANTRTLCCILETHQTDKGINVPQVLRKYMDDIDLIPFVN